MKEQFHFVLFEIEHFQNHFGQARTIPQTIVRGVVRRWNDDPKDCRLLLLFFLNFFNGQLEKRETVNDFSLVEKEEKRDEIYIRVQKKKRRNF